MGSKSKNNMKRFMAKRAKRANEDFNDYGFWTEALSAIETCEQGKNLSWRNRALLHTRFCLRLHDLCERHGLGVPDGYIEAVHALIEKRRLEWFEQDAIDRIKKLLTEIIMSAQSLRGGLDVTQAFIDRQIGSHHV